MSLTGSLFDKSTCEWLIDHQFYRNSEMLKMAGNGSHEIYLIKNAANDQIIMKRSIGSANDMISVEAHGLALIAETNTVGTPNVHHVSERCTSWIIFMAFRKHPIIGRVLVLF